MTVQWQICGRMAYSTGMEAGGGGGVRGQNVSLLKGNNGCFPNCREYQANGDSTGIKKLKMQYKVTAKLPYRRVVQFLSPTVQFTLQKFIFFISSLYDFFFKHPPFFF